MSHPRDLRYLILMALPTAFRCGVPKDLIFSDQSRKSLDDAPRQSKSRERVELHAFAKSLLGQNPTPSIALHLYCYTPHILPHILSNCISEPPTITGAESRNHSTIISRNKSFENAFIRNNGGRTIFAAARRRGRHILGR
jgi:hypothetical protein